MTITKAPKPILEGVRPFCKVCGWRKGGVDSWDGVACKCGHTSPSLGYAYLPCPICRGVEGCDHSVPERARAAKY